MISQNDKPKKENKEKIVLRSRYISLQKNEKDVNSSLLTNSVQYLDRYMPKKVKSRKSFISHRPKSPQKMNTISCFSRRSTLPLATTNKQETEHYASLNDELEKESVENVQMEDETNLKLRMLIKSIRPLTKKCDFRCFHSFFNHLMKDFKQEGRSFLMDPSPRYELDLEMLKSTNNKFNEILKIKESENNYFFFYLSGFLLGAAEEDIFKRTKIENSSNLKEEASSFFLPLLPEDNIYKKALGVTAKLRAEIAALKLKEEQRNLSYWQSAKNFVFSFFSK